MGINEILKMDSNSDCKIHYDHCQEWNKCYYQQLDETLDPNNLPLLDKKYHADAGDPFLNDKNEQVFDPSQEIEYTLDFDIECSLIYSSKTFIRLLQKKINELISSDEINIESDENELWDAMGFYYSDDEEVFMGETRGLVMNIAGLIGCDDLITIKEEVDDEGILWFSSVGTGNDQGGLFIEELK